jgi:CO/xanthine dehydrogenase Mo-binding subunit
LLADRNFFDYPLLGIDEMPEIVPIVLPSDRPPQGFGDPSRSEAAMSKKEA